MERRELISSKEYWLAKLQTQLFEAVEDYIKDNKLNRGKFATKIGVSKGYVSQVLNGDYDHRLSKFIELSLSVGKVPSVEFKDLNEFIKIDAILENGAVFNCNIATTSYTINVQQNIQQNVNYHSMPFMEIKPDYLNTNNSTVMPLSILKNFESLNNG